MAAELYIVKHCGVLPISPSLCCSSCSSNTKILSAPLVGLLIQYVASVPTQKLCVPCSDETSSWQMFQIPPRADAAGGTGPVCRAANKRPGLLCFLSPPEAAWPRIISGTKFAFWGCWKVADTSSYIKDTPFITLLCLSSPSSALTRSPSFCSSHHLCPFGLYCFVFLFFFTKTQWTNSSL